MASLNSIEIFNLICYRALKINELGFDVSNRMENEVHKRQLFI
jgi:hypothetical protein